MSQDCSAFGAVAWLGVQGSRSNKTEILSADGYDQRRKLKPVRGSFQEFYRN